MRLTFALFATALVAFAVLTPASLSSPIEGAVARKLDVPAQGLIIPMQFRGGQRASVQVVGDHKSGGIVHVAVKDAKDNLIAEDKGRELPVGDLAAVIWYPPRDGEYRITIRNLDNRAAKYFVAIR
jgi:hypothetical protein